MDEAVREAFGQETSRVLTDAWSREIRYLRVSVTDRCNYRCAYCHPSDGWKPTGTTQLMTIDDIVLFVTWMVNRGVRKVRLTGGEPLIRKGIVELVTQLRGIASLEEIVMTTNGHLLTELAGPLR